MSGAGFYLKECLAADVPTPASGKIAIFLNSATDTPNYKDDAGVVHEFPVATETIQDIVGAMVSSSEFAVTYNDGAGTLTINLPNSPIIFTVHLTAQAVSFSKMQNIATDRLIGRDTAASGSPEELTVGGGVEFTGSGGIQRSALTGEVTAAAGSNATTVAGTHSGSAHHAESHASRHQDGGADELDLYNLDLAVGTATGALPSEIVIGTSPQGELGGTWASPTVDATHSGSAHHAQAHGAADHTDVSRSIWIPAETMTLDGASFVTAGSSPNSVRTIRCADGADTGAFFNVAVPLDWASGSWTLTPYWSGGAGATGAIRWQATTKVMASGSVATAAGTADAWTGASATRAANELTIDTAGTLTPTPVAGQLYRMTLKRLGTDGADSYTANCDLLGVLLTYTASQ